MVHLDRISVTNWLKNIFAEPGKANQPGQANPASVPGSASGVQPFSQDVVDSQAPAKVASAQAPMIDLGPRSTARLPERIAFSTHQLQYNNRYLFGLDDKGRLLFKANPDMPIGKDAVVQWSPVLGSGTPTGKGLHNAETLANVRFKRISVDGPMLTAVSTDGRVYRINNALEANPDKLAWSDSWGWPFDKGPQLKERDDLYPFVTSLVSTDTSYYNIDSSGNKFKQFIGHLFAVGKDGYVHHTDPWTPTDWGYRFPLPEKGTFVPSQTGLDNVPKGMCAAGSLVAVIGSEGIYTIHYDFDCAGGNPALNYSSEPQPHFDRIDKQDVLVNPPITIPVEGWRKQPSIPGKFTGNIQVSHMFAADGSVVPGPNARVLRVLGLGPAAPDGQEPAGFWEKRLDEPGWRFVACEAFDSQTIRSRLINAEPQGRIPSDLRDYAEQPASAASHPDREARLLGFGMNMNYFDPATLRLTLPGSKNPIDLELFTHIQLRTSVRERPGLDGKADYFGGHVLIPESLRGDSAEAKALREALGLKKGEKFLELVVKADPQRVELFRPAIPLNADLVNGLNDRLGKRLFVFEA